MSSTYSGLEPRIQHLRLTPTSSSSSSSTTRSMSRTSSAPNPNSVIRRVAVAATPNSVSGAAPLDSCRTYINVQPAAIASRMHGTVITNPGSTTQWPVNHPFTPVVNTRVSAAAAATATAGPSPASAGGSAPTTPVIPQSQEVKQFIREPSYSTILQLQREASSSRAAAAASSVPPAIPASMTAMAAAAGVATPSSSSSSAPPPIYANYSALSSTYSEGLKSSDSQGSGEEEILGIVAAARNATAGSIYNSPPSPVSSSYSELRQATKYPPGYHLQQYLQQQRQQQQATAASGGGGGAATYESLYEPIQNPASGAPHYFYDPIKQQLYTSTKSSRRAADAADATAATSSRVQKSGGSGSGGSPLSESSDYFGLCSKCRDPIVGEGSGCTAMGRMYHVACFTCSHCHCLLQGKPFYALDGKPYCQADYLETLEKCCKCLGPILDRILRATGKPYHPQCFTCVVCNESLDGVPFTVDAANQIHCIEDFHRQFAPKCSVCRHPIMPRAAGEEAVRVVALDRSFHVECYKCEDCGVLLSNEEDAGCYPLDDHVLCKNCNTKRIHVLTNGMGTD